MESESVEIPPWTMPIHRYYYSLTSMISDICKSKKGEEFHRALYGCIYPYYQDTLALLRAQLKFTNLIKKQEEEFESWYLERRKNLDEAFDSADEEDKDILTYQMSKFLEKKLHFYEDRDLERDLFLRGIIVQFLSSLESTLHLAYESLLELDTDLLDINKVCKRDKGIVKYLKYFEKELLNTQVPVLIGTVYYLELRQWIEFRNNIVHNNNEVTLSLKQIIAQRKLQVKEENGKIFFNELSVNNLANLCGECLDILIEQVFRPYFIRKCVMLD